MFTKSNSPPWVFFTFFKLYKWFQITHRITHFKKYLIFTWLVYEFFYQFSSLGFLVILKIHLIIQFLNYLVVFPHSFIRIKTINIAKPDAHLFSQVMTVTHVMFLRNPGRRNEKSSRHEYHLLMKTNRLVLYGSRYSRMDQVKFVEESL